MMQWFGDDPCMAAKCKALQDFLSIQKKINLMVACPPTQGCSWKHLQLCINKPGQRFKAKGMLLYPAITAPSASSLLL